MAAAAQAGWGGWAPSVGWRVADESGGIGDGGGDVGGLWLAGRAGRGDVVAACVGQPGWWRVYLLLCWLLRVQEIGQFWAMARQRLGR